MPQPLEVLPGDSDESGETEIPFPLIVTVNIKGNVALFMNHSCSPNLSWQLVSRVNSGASDLHVVFHATIHIPPMTELTYDYGAVQLEVPEQSMKACLCGSIKCKGHLH